MPTLLITRLGPAAIDTATLLKERGHTPLIIPMGSVTYNAPPDDALLPEFQAILATSGHAVRALAQMKTPPFSIPLLTVGDQTAALAKQLGFLDITSASGDAKALINLTRTQCQTSKGPLLYAAGNIITGNVVGLLKDVGFSITQLEVYRVTPLSSFSSEDKKLLAGGVDGVLFFSSQTAKTFCHVASKSQQWDIFRGVPAFCLSSSIAKALDDTPFSPILSAKEPSQESLLEMLSNFQFNDRLNLPPKGVL